MRGEGEMLTFGSGSQRSSPRSLSPKNGEKAGGVSFRSAGGSGSSILDGEPGEGEVEEGGRDGELDLWTE